MHFSLSLSGTASALGTLVETTKTPRRIERQQNNLHEHITKPHQFQALCKRAKRQQHFCKELEKFNIQLCL